jgi:hypothetical protein
MAKCGFPACLEAATGGFQKTFDVTHTTSPVNEEVNVGRIVWCEDHKSSLIGHTKGKRGVFLSLKELRD